MRNDEFQFSGSPPPMRGKVHVAALGLLAVRITPAYAGKRSESLLRPSCRKDHPRLCGEKSQSPFWMARMPGSPPPMRGKASLLHLPYFNVGITPAYAGKRVRRKSRSPASRDHPRLCGEKAGKSRLQCMATGSPPPMRGKDYRYICKKARSRITPAYAWKSQLALRIPAALWDHPRLCGEKRVSQA